MEVVAVPLVFQSSSTWAGNDGNWSTFPLAVGSPPQRFNVLLSTAAGEAWVPAPEACSGPYPNYCTVSRGIESAQGSQSIGFQANNSSTWSQIGIYELGFEQDLFGSEDAGLYGQDILAFGDYASGVENQTVAAIATPNFWLGTLGLGVQPPEFDVRPEGLPSPLSNLKAQNVTPSLAYGYGAGASYRSSPGSLIIGGYDPDAFEPNDLSFPTNYDSASSLTVSIRSLVVTNTLQGTISMPISAGLNMSVDSAVSHLWLPEDICESLATSLGLTYDPDTDLYLVYTASRDRLLQSPPVFTFTLAVHESSDKTMNIVLPYAALDLKAGLPMYNSSTSYFPIRRAANDSQFVLGRAFLQEAYIVVDWERSNFTLGQALHDGGSTPKNIVPILPPGVEAPSRGKGLGTRAIAGIAVGAAVFVMLLCVVVWLCRRQRWTSGEKADPAQGREFMDDKDDGVANEIPELLSEERHELQTRNLKHQLMSNELHELPGHAVEQELGVR